MITLLEKQDNAWSKIYIVVCPYCGHKVRYYSYIMRNCNQCGKSLPINPLEIKNNINQQCTYHFEKEPNA